MNQDEIQWEKLLKIRTSGRDDSHSDQYHYPYEPTPYRVLERISNSGLIGKKNILLDYGTGKGRVCFFLSYQTRCKTIGIEYDERIFYGAEENKERAVSGERTSFVMTNAEHYLVPDEVDRCYFFNPFSVEILQKVLAKIYNSYYENPREIQLFFYYPSDEYVSYLMTQEQLIFSDEIDCRDLFQENDSREKILIFEILQTMLEKGFEENQYNDADGTIILRQYSRNLELYSLQSFAKMIAKKGWIEDDNL